MLTTDPDLQTRLGLAAALDGHAHHRADAVAIEDLERVRWDDLFLDVSREEALLRVVARDAEHGLREVVGAEREELGLRSDLVRDDAGARDLDHRAELVVDTLPALLEDRLRDLGDMRFESIELTHRRDEGHHDLRLRLDALLGRVDGRAEDRADLHLEYFRIDEEQAASAQAEHRVVLVELLEPSVDSFFVGEVGPVLAGGTRHGDIDIDVGVLAKELVKRWVDQPNHDRQSVHRLVHLAEIALLEREELRERALSSGGVVRKDHVLNDRETLGLTEHVLGPCETHALGAELAREAAFPRRVRVDPDAKLAALVGP